MKKTSVFKCGCYARYCIYTVLLNQSIVVKKVLISSFYCWGTRISEFDSTRIDLSFPRVWDTEEKVIIYFFINGKKLKRSRNFWFSFCNTLSSFIETGTCVGQIYFYWVSSCLPVSLITLVLVFWTVIYVIFSLAFNRVHKFSLWAPVTLLFYSDFLLLWVFE